MPASFAGRCTAQRDRPSAFVLVLALGLALSAATAAEPPVAEPDEATVPTDLSPFLIDVVANDSDADGEPLSLSLVTPPELGSVADQGDGTFLYTPAPSFPALALDTFAYRVADPQGGSATAEVAVRWDREEPYLLREYFVDPALPGWQVVDATTNQGPSNWFVDGSELRQTTNINHPQPTSISHPGTNAFWKEGLGWSDYRMSFFFRSTVDEGWFGTVFRYRDEDNFYLYSWAASIAKQRLVKKVDGVYTLLAEDVGSSFALGRRYRLDVTAVGSSLAVAVDGVQVFSVTDHSLPTGTVGLHCSAQSSAFFDDVFVQLASSTDPPPAPLASASLWDSSLTGWTVFDDTTYQGPSDWRAQDGEIAQFSNIHDIDRPLALGTYLLWDAGGSWSDAHLSFYFRSTDDDLIGLMFRYVDTGNYYRVRVNPAAFTFDKLSGGDTLTVLAEGPLGYTQHSYHRVDVILRGSTIEVLLDGRQRLSVVDAEHAAGKLALYARANTGARYDDVRVAALP